MQPPKKVLSKEQIEALKKPLPPESVKPHESKSFLSSIKAIYVVERFNDVFGIGGWKIENVVVKETEKWTVVKSTFIAEDYGIVIPDIFGGNDNIDLGDRYKGACTDALTKIGSYLYIGMDVYKGLGDKMPEKPKPPASGQKKELPWLNPGKNTAWLNAHTKFHTGQVDLDGIKKAYRVSKETEAKLRDPNFKP